MLRLQSILNRYKVFLGLFNFYNRFIPNFSTAFAPLYKLLKKNVCFNWGNKQENCFNYVKSLFKTDKLLKLFNPNFETAIETDASSCGIGAVLMHQHGDAWYPVQFASRTLNSAERNYSQIEREALTVTVLFGCEKFRQFLLGSRFIIKNDHKPLKKVIGGNSGIPLNCSARLQR